MKLFLALLLITNIALAETKVSVENTKNGRKFGATFDNEELADSWIARQLDNNSFGKPDRWERITDGSHTDTREVEVVVGGETQTYTEYFFPKEYVITKFLSIIAYQ